MSSSFSTKLPKRDQLTITTTKLADEDHPFPTDTSKSILSRDIGIFQELLSSKTLQSTVLDTIDNQALVEEHEFSQELTARLTRDHQPSNKCSPTASIPPARCSTASPSHHPHEDRVLQIAAKHSGTLPLCPYSASFSQQPIIHHICKINTYSSTTTLSSPPWVHLHRRQINGHPI